MSDDWNDIAAEQEASPSVTHHPEGLISATITDQAGTVIWQGPMANETPRARAARELLLARHLTNMVKQHEKVKSDAAAELFTKVKQQEPAELDGANLGAVRVDAGASVWSVTDYQALLAWCEQHAPDEVQQAIPFAELEATVRRVQAVVDIVAQAGLDAVALVDLLDALEPREVDRQVRPSYVAALLKLAREGKPVLEQDTGAEVPARSLPFLSQQQAPPKLVVTVSKGDDGQEAQRAILRRMGPVARVLGLDAGVLGLLAVEGA